MFVVCLLHVQHTDLQRTLYELQSEIRSLSDQQVLMLSVHGRLMILVTVLV